MPRRAHVLAQLADLIVAARPARIAVDGPDAAGKTTLADELAPLLAARSHPVARVSLDDFLRPCEERYRRGSESPAGYYLDSFDHEALQRALEPAGAALVDGVFLLRPELRELWDFAVLVECDFDELLRRALARDGEQLRGRYLRRYLPAQRRYLADVEPAGLADVVVENTDPAAPVLRLR